MMNAAGFCHAWESLPHASPHHHSPPPAAPCVPTPRMSATQNKLDPSDQGVSCLRHPPPSHSHQRTVRPSQSRIGRRKGTRTTSAAAHQTSPHQTSPPPRTVRPSRPESAAGREPAPLRAAAHLPRMTRTCRAGPPTTAQHTPSTWEWEGGGTEEVEVRHTHVELIHQQKRSSSPQPDAVLSYGPSSPTFLPHLCERHLDDLAHNAVNVLCPLPAVRRGVAQTVVGNSGQALCIRSSTRAPFSPTHSPPVFPTLPPPAHSLIPQLD